MFFFFRQLLFLLSASVILSSTCLASDISVSPSINVIINNQKLSLKNPILMRDNSHFVSLRDLSKAMQAPLRYDRKHDRYQLKFKKNNYTVSFLPNSTELFLNSNRHFLSQPTLFSKGQVYVPVTAFFQLINGSAKISPSTIRLSFSRLPQTSKRRDHLIYTDMLRYPYFESGRPLSVMIEGTIYDLSDQFLYRDSLFYISIAHVFSKLGYQITISEDSYTLRKNKSTYTFSFTSPLVNIQSPQGTYRLNQQGPAIRKNGKIYLPLNSIVSALDYGLYWDSRNRIITFLSAITDLSFVKKNNQEQLRVIYRHSIKPEEAELFRFRKGYSIDIPYSYPLLSDKPVKLTHPFISKIRVKRLNKHTTRLFIYAKQTLSYPTPIATTPVYTYTFNTVLTRIQELVRGQRHYVSITGSGPFSASKKIATKPNRVIIDIPHSVPELPQIIKPQSELLSKIEVEKIKNTSRITLTYKGDLPKISQEYRQGKYSIYFPKQLAIAPVKPTPKIRPVQKKRQAKIAAPKSRKQTLKKSRVSGKHVLSGKIIVIDAGHGGGDPGALGIKREFEKKYTLDVAKRLQRLLAKQGAFVIMTRKYDHNPGLYRRSLVANRNKSDLFISIHFNSFVKSGINGTETYYYKYKDRKLAYHLQRQMVKDIKLKDLGVKRSRLYVLRHSKMPSALVEPAFMTNPGNLRKIKQASFRQKLAQSLYQGIVNYFKDT